MMRLRPLSIFLLLAGMMVFLTACGQIASERELRKKADKNGKNTFLRTEEDDSRRTCYFRDELGFEYSISSYDSDIYIDGTSFGSVVSSSSDYEEQYLRYVADKTNEALGDCTAKMHMGEYGWLQIWADPAGLPENAETAAREFKKQDIRELFDEYELYVMDKDDGETELGRYSFTYDYFLGGEEGRAFFYMERIRDYYGAEPTYVRSEHVAFESIPELKNYNIVSGTTNSDPRRDGVEVYYFQVDGKNYFITDVLCYGEDGTYSNARFFNTYGPMTE